MDPKIAPIIRAVPKVPAYASLYTCLCYKNYITVLSIWECDRC